MSCKETTRMTFIEYLLESKEKKAAKKQLSEAYQTPPHNDLHLGIDLKLGVLKAALEARCFDDRSEVKLVRVSSRQIKSCRNEFGWQPGSTEAEIHAQDPNPNQPTLVSDLKNDINAMQEAGANLDQVYVKIGNFSIDGHSSHREILLGWNDHEQHPTLWVGVKTSANDLEQFVIAGGEFPAQPDDEEAAAQAPEQQAPAPQQQDATNDDGKEEEEEDKDHYNTIHGIKFKSGDDLAVANVAQVNRMLPVIVGKWSYTDFTSKVAQTNAAEMNFFKSDEVGKCTYKQINWDDSVDSFVKRLGFIQFKKVGPASRIDAIMQLAFNGHPAIVQFQDIGIDYPITVLRQPCSTWYKRLVQLYLTWYKSSPRGIQVLFDRDHFFRKNSKYNIQQDPPFTIGLAVRGEANATPNAAQQGGGGQAARPATAPAHRAPRGVAAAEETLQQRLSQMLTQKDLNMVQTGFGIPTVKKGMKKIFGADSGYKMLINFPGVDKTTKMVGDEAVQFLDQYGIWNGMYKDVYDAVKAAHDDVQLVVKFDGDLV